MNRILIVGAASALAQEVGRCFAREEARLFLVGRTSEKLEAVRQDLAARGAEVAGTFELDANDTGRHAGMLEAGEEALGTIDAALIAYGTLPDQKACEASVEKTLKALSTNATSTIALMTQLANRFEGQGKGHLAVISSVAGDRGRESNYVYGAAKAAVTTFAEGLRSRLNGSKVSVLTVKPGPVDTPMTEHMKKSALFSEPEVVGQEIYEAMRAERDGTLYTPRFWRLVMTGIRVVPERLFKQLSL